MPVKIPASEYVDRINNSPNITFVRWDDPFVGNRSKAVCRCIVDGFEWSATVNNLLNHSRGCPQCSGHRRWTADERIEQINALPNIKFVRWDGPFVGNKSKAVYRCTVDGFEWSGTVNNLVNHCKGCPQCGRRSARNKLVVPREDYESKITEKGVGRYEFIKWTDNVHQGNRSKASLKCTVDGYEWESVVSHILTGKGCPECAGVRRWTADERIDQINSNYGMTFVQWDGIYINNESKAICKCDVDGFEWSARVSTLIKGHGCPQCAGKRQWTSDECSGHIDALQGITFVRWDGGYTGSKSKAICRCDEGHYWSVSVGSVLHQCTGCPQCSQGGYNPGKPGTLYALRSDCGTMIKIGISNDHERRHRELVSATPFTWGCVELLHGDGVMIAALEKAFHGMTEPVIFSASFQGHTEWRKWDARIPEWFKQWREMT